MAHKNIPIFIPHLGCPNQCVFCNQRSISGCHEFREASVRETIGSALSTVNCGDETEIAFFGGSFTGIDRDLMIRLLETAEEFVRAGKVSSIRLSTRPDYVSEEILKILSGYSVRTVELGIQSTDDAVLAACRRGHSAKDAELAARAVVDVGFALVGQMMIGLPGATPESEIRTARQIVSFGASAVRIYPTVVFRDTPLCDMAKRGEYRPLTLSEAIARSADVLEVFEAAGIPCIRLGLCAGEELTSTAAVYAGPNEPALGEMVWSELYYRRLTRLVREAGLLGKEIVVTADHREISKIVGQHKTNLERLLRETGTRVQKITGRNCFHGLTVTPWSGYAKSSGGNEPCT